MRAARPTRAVRCQAMRALVVVLALTGCGRIGFAELGASGSSDWWDPAWTQRVKLVIDNQASPEGLIDFPLMVRLDSTRFDPSAARPDGGDLRFVDVDGQTVLDHDLEMWDFELDGQAVAWVRVPRIAAGAADGVVWLYYGNPAATPRPAAPTWSAAYRAVYHLGADLRDATANANDGTGAQTPGPTQGRIGLGRSFLDANHNAIEIADAASLHPKTALTLSGWMTIRRSDTTWRCLISRATPLSDDSNDLWLGVYLDKTYTEAWTERAPKDSQAGPVVPTTSGSTSRRCGPARASSPTSTASTPATRSRRPRCATARCRW